MLLLPLMAMWAREKKRSARAARRRGGAGRLVY